MIFGCSALMLGFGACREAVAPDRTSCARVTAPSVLEPARTTPSRAPSAVEPTESAPPSAPTTASSASEPTDVAPPTSAPSQRPLPAKSRVKAQAREGCRAPDRAGCGSCCFSGPDGCTILSGDTEWDPHAEVDPWYNIFKSAKGACPADCPKCAQCSERDEAELMRLLPFSCDCKHVDLNIDPCFFPSECACKCSRYGDLSGACPIGR